MTDGQHAPAVFEFDGDDGMTLRIAFDPAGQMGFRVIANGVPDEHFVVIRDAYPERLGADILDHFCYIVGQALANRNRLRRDWPAVPYGENEVWERLLPHVAAKVRKTK